MAYHYNSVFIIQISVVLGAFCKYLKINAEVLMIVLVLVLEALNSVHEPMHDRCAYMSVHTCLCIHVCACSVHVSLSVHAVCMSLCLCNHL